MFMLAGVCFACGLRVVRVHIACILRVYCVCFACGLRVLCVLNSTVFKPSNVFLLHTLRATNMCCNLDPLKAHPAYPARSTAPITTRACFTMSMPVSSHIASNSSSRQGDGCGEETIESPPSDEPSSAAALALGIDHPLRIGRHQPLARRATGAAP